MSDTPSEPNGYRTKYEEMVLASLDRIEKKIDNHDARITAIELEHATHTARAVTNAKWWAAIISAVGVALSAAIKYFKP
jgi:hypothetical protein